MGTIRPQLDCCNAPMAVVPGHFAVIRMQTFAYVWRLRRRLLLRVEDGRSYFGLLRISNRPYENLLARGVRCHSRTATWLNYRARPIQILLLNRLITMSVWSTLCALPAPRSRAMHAVA